MKKTTVGPTKYPLEVSFTPLFFIKCQHAHPNPYSNVGIAAPSLPYKKFFYQKRVVNPIYIGNVSSLTALTWNICFHMLTSKDRTSLLIIAAK